MVGVRRVGGIPALHHRSAGCLLCFEVPNQRHVSLECELQPFIGSPGVLGFLALVIQLVLGRHTEVAVGCPLELELLHWLVGVGVG